jgi:hypothetical protein
VSGILEFTARAVLIGVGATVVMDLWAVLLKRCFGIPSLDYRLVGRWLGHMPRGRFAHDNIAAVSPARGELILGWGAHYAIGIVFAALLLVLCGRDWAHQPTLAPALGMGLATLVAPFFVMQPGMGFGVAASKTPKANTARLRSVAAHTVFGIGLYVAAWIAARFIG